MALALSGARVRQWGVLAVSAPVLAWLSGLLLTISVSELFDAGIPGVSSWGSEIRDSVLTPGLFFVLAGAAFGGGFDVTADSVGSGWVGFTAQGTLGLVAWGAVLALALLAWWIVRRGELSQVRSLPWRQAAVRSVLDAVPASVLMVLLFGFSQASFGDSRSLVITLSSRGWVIFFTVVLAVALPTFLARWGGPEAAVFSRVRTAAGEALRVCDWFGGVLGVVAMIGAVVAVVTGSIPGSVPLSMLPYLGNVVFSLLTWGVGAGLHYVLGGPLVNLAGSFGGQSNKLGRDNLYFAWDFSGAFFWVLLILMIVTMLVVAARVGTHRSRTAGPDWRRTWQMPAIVFVIALLGTWSTGMSVSGTAGISIMSGNQGGGVTAGIGPAWYAPVFVLVLAALISCGAEVLPLFLFQLAPRLLVLVAGRNAVERWLHGQPSPQKSSGTQLPSDSAVVPVPVTVFPEAKTPEKSSQPHTGVQPGELVPSPPVGEITPMSPRTKKRIRAGAFIVLGLAVVAGVAAGAVAFLNSARNPDAVVRSYAELLQNGKAAEASKLVDPGISFDKRALLTDKAMEKAVRIQVVSVEVKDKRDKDATVTLTYSLDGQRSTKDFTVVKGDPEFGFLDTWQLRDPFLTSTSIATVGLDAVTVGEQPVTVPEGSGFGGIGMTDTPDHVLSLPVYPGIYTVGAASTKFMAVQSERLTVQGDSSTSEGGPGVTLKRSITPAAESAVLDQVKAFAQACVTVPTNTNDGCPYPLQNKKLHSMKMLSAPSSVKIEDDGSFTSDAAKFEYTPDPFFEGDKPEAETSEFAFKGKFVITSEGVKATDIAYTYG
ncbi:hypothetical protein [Arthrobacter sp. RAF14]|uniref:hypothetical protein n=1 Tax=Arthrobacter sp. RAF14 TaxID=3233051 RepID=UPI003F92D418